MTTIRVSAAGPPVLLLLFASSCRRIYSSVISPSSLFAPSVLLGQRPLLLPAESIAILLHSYSIPDISLLRRPAFASVDYAVQT